MSLLFTSNADPSTFMPKTQKISDFSPEVSPNAQIHKQALLLQPKSPQKLTENTFQNALKLSKEAQIQRAKRIKQQQTQVAKYLNFDEQDRILQENLKHDEKLRRAQEIRDNFRQKLAKNHVKPLVSPLPKIVIQGAKKQIPIEIRPKQIVRNVQDLKKNEQIYRGIVRGKVQNYGQLKPIDKVVDEVQSEARPQNVQKAQNDESGKKQRSDASKQKSDLVQRQKTANYVENTEVQTFFAGVCKKKLIMSMLKIQLYKKNQLNLLKKIIENRPVKYVPRCVQEVECQKHFIAGDAGNGIVFGILTHLRAVEQLRFQEFAGKVLGAESYVQIDRMGLKQAQLFISAMPELMFSQWRIVENECGVEVCFGADKKLSYLNQLVMENCKCQLVDKITQILELFVNTCFGAEKFSQLQRTQFLQFLLLRNDFRAFMVTESCVLVEIEGKNFEIFTSDAKKLLHSSFPIQKIKIENEVKLYSGMRIRHSIVDENKLVSELMEAYQKAGKVAQIEYIDCGNYCILHIELEQIEIEEMVQPQIAKEDVSYQNTCYFGIPNNNRHIPLDLQSKFTSIMQNVYNYSTKFTVADLDMDQAQFLIKQIPELFFTSYNLKQSDADVVFTAQQAISNQTSNQFAQLNNFLNDIYYRSQIEPFSSIFLAFYFSNQFGLENIYQCFESNFCSPNSAFTAISLICMRNNLVFQKDHNDQFRVDNQLYDLKENTFEVQIPEFLIERELRIWQLSNQKKLSLVRTGTMEQVQKQITAAQPYLQQKNLMLEDIKIVQKNLHCFIQFNVARYEEPQAAQIQIPALEQPTGIFYKEVQILLYSEFKNVERSVINSLIQDKYYTQDKIDDIRSKLVNYKPVEVNLKPNSITWLQACRLLKQENPLVCRVLAQRVILGLVDDLVDFNEMKAFGAILKHRPQQYRGDHEQHDARQILNCNSHIGKITSKEQLDIIYQNTCYFGIPNNNRHIPLDLQSKFTSIMQNVYNYSTKFTVADLDMDQAQFLIKQIPELFFTSYNLKQSDADVVFTAQQAISNQTSNQFAQLNNFLNDIYYRSQIEPFSSIFLAFYFSNQFGLENIYQCFESNFCSPNSAFTAISLICMRNNLVFQKDHNDQFRVDNQLYDLKENTFEVQIPEFLIERELRIWQLSNQKKLSLVRTGTMEQVQKQITAAQPYLQQKNLMLEDIKIVQKNLHCFIQFNVARYEEPQAAQIQIPALEQPTGIFYKEVQILLYSEFKNVERSVINSLIQDKYYTQDKIDDIRSKLVNYKPVEVNLKPNSITWLQACRLLKQENPLVCRVLAQRVILGLVDDLVDFNEMKAFGAILKHRPQQYRGDHEQHETKQTLNTPEKDSFSSLKVNYDQKPFFKTLIELGGDEEKIQQILTQRPVMMK